MSHGGLGESGSLAAYLVMQKQLHYIKGSASLFILFLCGSYSKPDTSAAELSALFRLRPQPQIWLKHLEYTNFGRHFGNRHSSRRD